MSFFPARLITRRRALWLGLSLPVPLIVACGGSDSTPDTLTSASAESTGGGSTETTTASGATATLPPTPACTDDDEPTAAQTEGPYFTPNSPERTSLLEAGMPGTTLVLTGRVANTGCQPVARALLDFVTLSRLEGEPARVLSGGQRKLLELARVLMADPAAILLDEPAAGVNPTLLEFIIDRVLELNAEGRSILLIEHNMDMVAQLCSRVVVMAGGRYLTEGAPDDIARDPAVVDAYLGGVA